MKKLLIFTVLMGVSSQFLLADIMQGGLETSASIGVNIPVSTSQSNSFFSSFGPGLDLNVQSIYGLNENSGLGLGIGIMSLSPTSSNTYKELYDHFNASPPDGTINILPIYAVYKYEFLTTQYKPFLQAKLGYAVPISSASNISYYGSTLNESYTGGVFLGVGAGVYLTNNIFLEADLNYYQTTQQFTGNIYSGNNTMNLFTTGLQVGYTF